jgi:hypothetical protein
LGKRANNRNLVLNLADITTVILKLVNCSTTLNKKAESASAVS